MTTTIKTWQERMSAYEGNGSPQINFMLIEIAALRAHIAELEAQAMTPKLSAHEQDMVDHPNNYPHISVYNKMRVWKDGLQAQVDELMFEFCPERMTKEQIETYAEHQRKVDPDKVGHAAQAPAPLAVSPEALEDMRTHRNSWRNALVLTKERAQILLPDTDDAAYWQHEIEAFDRTFSFTDPLPTAADIGLGSSAGVNEAKVVEGQAGEELLSRYWHLAYDEGKNGVSHGDEANDVLHSLRSLLTSKTDVQCDFTVHMTAAGMGIWVDEKGVMWSRVRPDLQEGAPKKLWLWKNFVDGVPEYWAFDNAFPTQLSSGDPQTLGEPCGYALFKRSGKGHTGIADEEVLRRIAASQLTTPQVSQEVELPALPKACYLSTAHPEDRNGIERFTADQMREYGKQCAALSRVPAEQTIEGYVMTPHFRGYANLGTGQYVINHTADAPPGLLISIATEEQKAGRAIGEERDSAPGTLIQPETVAVHIGFENVNGLDALEKQLHYLREVHFGESRSADQPSAPNLTDAQCHSIKMKAVHEASAWAEALHYETSQEAVDGVYVRSIIKRAGDVFGVASQSSDLPMPTIAQGRQILADLAERINAVTSGYRLPNDAEHKLLEIALALKLFSPKPEQSGQAVVDGWKQAAEFVDKKADAYLSENASNEEDTGAVVFHFGDAGRDYHSGLVELADEIRAAAPKPPSETVTWSAPDERRLDQALHESIGTQPPAGQEGEPK